MIWDNSIFEYYLGHDANWDAGCDFLFHNSGIFPNNSEFVSYKSDFFPELRELLELSQNCEIKSRNYILFYLFSGGNKLKSDL